MKDILSKNKIYLVLIVIIIVYLLVILLVVGNRHDNKNKYLYIAFSDSSIWLYKDSRYENVDRNRDDYNWLNFELYNKEGIIGKYRLYNYNSKWYAYDDNKQEIDVGSFIAFNGNISYKLLSNYEGNFNENDLSNLNKLLDGIKIINISDLTTKRKIEVDIDSDKKNEFIYVVSNIGNDYDDKKFIIVYVYDESGYHVLEKKQYDEGQLINNVYDVNYIINIDKSKTYDIIVTDVTEDGVCNSLYSIKNKEYVKMIGC